ncbi:hypothetical protein OC834_007755, partial [Tilletia horrida]
EEEEDQEIEDLQKKNGSPPNAENGTDSEMVDASHKNGDDVDKQPTKTTAKERAALRRIKLQKEMELAPHVTHGRQRGWPLKLDEKIEQQRFRKILPRLRDVIRCPNDNFIFAAILAGSKPETLRRDIPFAGVKNEHCGLYGPAWQLRLNNWITHEAMCKKIAKRAVKPLFPHEFIERVLVPFASILMIQDLLGLSMSGAESVWKESKEFGDTVNTVDEVHTSSEEEDEDEDEDDDDDN